MKLRTGLLILAVAVLATWVAPSLRKAEVRLAHEFLTSPEHSLHAHPGVEPIQLALLVQTSVR